MEKQNLTCVCNCCGYENCVCNCDCGIVQLLFKNKVTMNFKFNKENLGIYILRLGLAIVFLYFGISQILDQSKWIYLVPERFFNFYINEIFKI